MELLRRRSECRKFMRDHLAPRKGRSYSSILKSLAEYGIHDIAGLAKADTAVLKNAGIGEKEASDIIAGARSQCATQTFKKIGIPAPSIKKYVDAGILSPGDFCSLHPLLLAEKADISPDTVYRHAGLVCKYLNRPAPKKVTKNQLEKGRKELMTIRGITEPVTRQLLRAGIVDAGSLLTADARHAASETGIQEQKIRDYQDFVRKKMADAIIQL
jgi:DNA topoisomerase-1